MKFEDLQKSWQEQPLVDLAETTKLKQQKSRWQKRQRKVLLANLGMSVGFLIAMSVIAWVYYTYHKEFGWPFRISIVTTLLLMIVFGIVNWRSYGFRQESREVSSSVYIRYQISKLQWQRNVIRYYTTVYTVLLWLALVLYTWEITNRGSALLKFSALAIITAYIGGFTLWTTIKRYPKSLLEINSLIAELELINTGLLANEEL